MNNIDKTKEELRDESFAQDYKSNQIECRCEKRGKCLKHIEVGKPQEPKCNCHYQCGCDKGKCNCYTLKPTQESKEEEIIEAIRKSNDDQYETYYGHKRDSIPAIKKLSHSEDSLFEEFDNDLKNILSISPIKKKRIEFQIKELIAKYFIPRTRVEEMMREVEQKECPNAWCTTCDPGHAYSKKRET